MSQEKVDLLLQVQSDLRSVNSLVAGLKRVESQGSATQRGLGRIGGALENLGGLATGALAPLLTGAAFAGMLKTAKDLAGAIVDLSSAAQMGTSAFQALDAHFGDDGVKMEDLARASESLRAKLQDAAVNGADPLNEKLRKFGLTAVGLQALAPERQWETIAARLSRATDRQAALNLAADLFGSKVAPKLTAGLQRLATDGFDQVAAAGQKLIIPEESLERLDRYGDAWDRVIKRMKQVTAMGVDDVLSVADRYQADRGGTKRSFAQFVYSQNLLTSNNGLPGLNFLLPFAGNINMSGMRDQAAQAKAARVSQIDSYSGRAMSVGDVAQLKNTAVMKRAEDKAMISGLSAAEIAAGKARVSEAQELWKHLQTSFEKVRETLAGDDKKVAEFTLKTQLLEGQRALDGFDASLKKLDGDPYLTDLAKRTQRIALINEENVAIAAQIERLNALAAATADPAQAAQIAAQIGDLSQRSARNSATVAGTPVGTTQELRAQLVTLQNGFLTVSQAISGTIGDSIHQVSSGIASWAKGATSFRQMLGDIKDNFLGGIIDRVVQMGVEWVAQTFVIKGAMAGVEALMSLFRKKRMVETAAEGTAAAAANAPGAAAASISSFGAAALIGVAALIAAMAAFGGFAKGGYTAPGAKNQVAGVVHAGEWVAPKWMVESPRYGNLIAGLEAERQGAPGYSLGGFFKKNFKYGGVPKWLLPKAVSHQMDNWNLYDGQKLYKGSSLAHLGTTYDARRGTTGISVEDTTYARAAGAAGTGATGTTARPTRFIVVDDQRDLSRALADSAYENHVVNVSRRRRSEIISRRAA